jgi:hypothetical protein
VIVILVGVIVVGVVWYFLKIRNAETNQSEGKLNREVNKTATPFVFFSSICKLIKPS